MHNKERKPIGKARRVIGDILIALVVLFTVYLSVIMLRRISTVVLKATYQKIFLYELALCAVTLLFALDLRFGFFTRMRPKLLKALGWVLRSAVIAAVCVILFFCGRVVLGGMTSASADADYSLVLGLALENGKPTDDLISRLRAAQNFLQEHPDAKLVLTGGNADASGRTEAAIMRDWLLEAGVSEERLILEDKADTTKANFRETAKLIDPEAPVVLITSDYHMARSVRTAKEAGFSQVLRLSAASSPLYYGANVMWEVVLELNDLTLKQE